MNQKNADICLPEIGRPAWGAYAWLNPTRSIKNKQSEGKFEESNGLELVSTTYFFPATGDAGRHDGEHARDSKKEIRVFIMIQSFTAIATPC